MRDDISTRWVMPRLGGRWGVRDQRYYSQDTFWTFGTQLHKVAVRCPQSRRSTKEKCVVTDAFSRWCHPANVHVPPTTERRTLFWIRNCITMLLILDRNTLLVQYYYKYSYII